MAIAGAISRRSAASRLVEAYGQEFVVLGAIVALFVIVGAVNPRFLSDTNLVNIFSGNAYIAVAAIGMSLVIISGHIDVSVGSRPKSTGAISTNTGYSQQHFRMPQPRRPLFPNR